MFPYLEFFQNFAKIVLKYPQIFLKFPQSLFVIFLQRYSQSFLTISLNKYIFSYNFSRVLPKINLRVCITNSHQIVLKIVRSVFYVSSKFCNISSYFFQFHCSHFLKLFQYFSKMILKNFPEISSKFLRKFFSISIDFLKNFSK